MEVLQNIVHGLEVRKEQRKQNEFDEKFNSIQGRIEATLEGYEVDRELLEKQMIDKVSTMIKFTENLEELQEIIQDSTKRNAHNEKTQIFIVGYKNKTNERLRILTEVFESLDIAAMDDVRMLQNNSGLDEINNSLDDSLQGVSGAIGKLDDISNEIIAILAANRTGAAAKKRRILERKLNTMKTDMEKLNQNLLFTKNEVAIQEQHNFQLQAKINLKNEDIDKLEAEKKQLGEVAEVAIQAKSQAQTDKMDVIFMYEARIKEMKKKIPDDIVCTNEGTQTEHCNISYIPESDDEDMKSINSDEPSVDIAERTQSAQPRLQVSSFEVIHITMWDRPKTADNSLLSGKAPQNIGQTENVESLQSISRPSTTTRECQTEDQKSAESNESTIAQPPSIKPKSPKALRSKSPKTLRSKSPKQASKSQIKVELKRPARTELVDTVEFLAPPEKHHRPASAVNTTKALVRCFNKLLWFSAEVEEVLNIQVFNRLTTTTDGETLIQMNDAELREEIKKMSNHVDKLLENISLSLKSTNGATISDKILDLPDDADDRYKDLYKNYQQTLNELSRLKSQTQTDENFQSIRHTKSTDEIHVKRMSSLRSQSTTTLSTFFGHYDKRQRFEKMSKDNDVIVPNNSPRSKNNVKRKITIDLEGPSESRSSIFQNSTSSMDTGYVESPKKLERLDSVTQSLISITDEYADNGLLKEFNSFTEKLTEQVIRKKDVSEDVGEEKNYRESFNDEVFDDKITSPNPIRSPQESEPKPLDLKIQNFAREWSRTIKSSEYAPEIFTGLNQMDLLEDRRDKIWTNLTRAINRLRYTVRYQIRKATKELRLRTIQKFQPDLLKLYIEGERFQQLKLEKSTEPIKHHRAGRIRSRGKLHDHRPEHYTIDNFDGFKLTGAGCLLNSINSSADLNPVIKLPSLKQSYDYADDESFTVPRILEMEIARSTVSDMQVKL